MKNKVMVTLAAACMLATVLSIAGCGGGGGGSAPVAPVYTQAVLKLKTVGTPVAGKMAGGWQVTVGIPDAGLSIKTVSASDMTLDATAFFASGVTPPTYTLQGSYNMPGSASVHPYLLVGAAAGSSDLLAGTKVGEVATLVFDIAPGAALPKKSSFPLSEPIVSEAAAGAFELKGVTFDVELSFR